MRDFRSYICFAIFLEARFAAEIKQERKGRCVAYCV